METIRTLSVVLVVAALAASACNNDTLLPSGNEIAEKNGAVCEPKPASELEDCNVWDETLIQIDTKEELREVCESDCRNIPNLSVFEIPGVTKLDAFANRQILEEITVRRMPDLKTTRGLNVQDGARVSVYSNPRLSDLQAVQNLTRAGKMWISNNNLKDLEAIKDLEEMVRTTMMAFLTISETQMTDFSALDGLNVNGDSVEFSENPRLQELPELIGVPSQVFIHSNESLSNISNLASLDVVLNVLVIRDNKNLKRCHIESVLEGVRLGADATVTIDGNSNKPCN